MFALIRNLTLLNARNDDGTEWNVFEKDQGREQWPDLPTYTASPAFDVSVRSCPAVTMLARLAHPPIFSILANDSKL